MNAPSRCYDGGGRSFKPSSLKSRARIPAPVSRDLVRSGTGTGCQPGLNAVRYRYQLQDQI
jgi:hypothetical protein